MPECEMIVLGNFKDKPLAGDGLLVPDTVFTVKHGLMLARSLVNSDQSRFCARIMNPSKEVVKIQKGTVLGLFEPVVAIEECDANDKTQDLVSYISETDSNKHLPLNLQEKGTSRQRSGKGAIRKRFPLQKPRWEKTKLTIRYLYHETYRKPNEQLFSQ